MASQDSAGRTNQKRRTYNAILQAAGQLIKVGGEVTMPEVAKAALVSEATAYRYFPDLVTLLQKAMAEQQPGPAEVLAPVMGSADPVERVAVGTEYLLRHVLTYQRAVRATIAATISHPDEAETVRPNLRQSVIDLALAPVVEAVGEDAPALVQLKRDLAVVVAAEALFCLIDSYKLSADEAISSIVHAATTLTRVAVSEMSLDRRAS